MSVAKPCLGYPSRTAAVLALRARGFSRAAIATRIGIDRSAVSALEISAARQRPAWSTAKQHTVAIDNDTLDTLRPHADRRGVSGNALIRQLLAILADDDLVDALLDDGS